MNSFCERLNYLLKNTKTTQQQVSLGANIDKTSISKYCNGKAVPDSKNLLKLADFFNVSPLWLSGEGDDPTVKQINNPTLSIDTTDLSPDAIELINKFLALPKDDQDLFVNLANKIFKSE